MSLKFPNKTFREKKENANRLTKKSIEQYTWEEN